MFLYPMVVFVLLAVLSVPELCTADTQSRSTLEIRRASNSPQLADFLDAERRETYARVTDFRQNEPGDGNPVSLKTDAYLSYDDKNLYVAFVCADEPEKIRARMAKREDIDSDDQVVVYLDTFNDHQRAYMFAANPLGIQMDGRITEGQDDDISFDTLWHSDGRLTADGYVVLMKIPFKSLRFSNADQQMWGIALGRRIRRNNEESYWPYITKRVEGFIPQFASLRALEDISPARNIQIIPYSIFSQARFLDSDIPRFSTDSDGSAGVDAKFVLRNALTLDATLNPDFSQVESDEPQVTINQRFEVFFPEKRPFFIENAGLLQTPINLFFSRRVIDPEVGGRLTGKMGSWAVGALAIDDLAPGKTVANTDPNHDKRAAVGVLRAKREFGEQSSLGVLATSRTFASEYNRVVALDSRVKLTPNLIASGQLAQTNTKDADGAKHSGLGYFVQLDRDGKHFDYTGHYLDLPADFRSELGFVRRVDIRQMEHSTKYRWRHEDRMLQKWGPSLTGLVNWNHDGRVEDWVIESELDFEFTGSTELEINRAESFERFEDQEFRKHATAVSFTTEWLSWLTTTAAYTWGTDVNFDPAAGLEPFLANAEEAELQLTLRPTPRIRFDQTYIYGHLGARRAQRLRSSSSTIFDNPIARWKLNYQFTRELSVRGILDYEGVSPNTALVDLEDEKIFSADVLLTYLLNPGTSLHLGYTDGYENVELTGTTPPELQRVNSPFTSIGRQVFVKVDYLLRF